MSLRFWPDGIEGRWGLTFSALFADVEFTYVEVMAWWSPWAWGFCFETSPGGPALHGWWGQRYRCWRLRK